MFDFSRDIYKELLAWKKDKKDQKNLFMMQLNSMM